MLIGPLEEGRTPPIFGQLEFVPDLRSQAWKLLPSLHSYSADGPLTEVLNDRRNCTAATVPYFATAQRMPNVVNLLHPWLAPPHERPHVATV